MGNSKMRSQLYISDWISSNADRNLPLTATISIIYLLTPWSRVLLEKLTGYAASQEIPRIFGIRRFLTVSTSDCHLSLSWANSIQSPQLIPTSWRSILILSSHLRLGLPNGLFPSGFPTRAIKQHFVLMFTDDKPDRLLQQTHCAIRGS